MYILTLFFFSFMSAIDSSKSQNDLEWQAAACEAYASTLMISGVVYDNYPLDNSGDGNIKDKHNKAIIEKCEEAFMLYGRRKCVELQIEVLMKLVRFYISIENLQDANDKLTDAYFLGNSLGNVAKVCRF